MKTIVILGAGTAGTAMAHKLRKRLSSDWDVAVVDPSTRHVYQPGLLFLPFGDETVERIVRERGETLGKGIAWHRAAVTAIDTERRRVAASAADSHLSNDVVGWQTTLRARGGRRRMMSLEAVQTDADGYLSNRDQWSEDLANELAGQFGVELTDEHWRVLNAARAIEAESGSSPGLRKISKRSETPIKAIYKLFPDGPAKLIAKIAGIPKPKSCL